MKRVTGIGGIFFKSKDPKQTLAWYKKHLGIPTDEYGWSFMWRSHDDQAEEGMTQWSVFSDKTQYLDPSEQPFMINYRVHDLAGLLSALKEEGVQQVGEMVEEPYGKFAWIMDPDGNKIELWEPPTASQPE